jgi:O-antigen ligase
MTIPIVNEKVNQMTTIFSDKSGREISGSSIEMRSIQFATTLYYIQDTPAFGRGVNFFYYDMGWEDGKRGLKDARFEGLEGVYLFYLLERGFIGYFLYLAVWIIMLVYLYRNRQNDKELSASGVAMWVIYTVFANMTGELLCVFPTLLVLGSMIGVLNTKNYLYGVKNNNFNNNSCLQANLP